jgi:ABC-type sugar transport system permease subunit
VLALLMNEDFRFRNLFRGMLFIPWLLPSMVVTLVFRWLYNDFYGYLNYILVKLHVIAQPVNILADQQLVWIGILIPIIWCSYPFAMLVFQAALHSIDKRLYEAARIDGANRVRSFFAVTLPAIRPTLIVAVILLVIWTFASFDLVYLMTRGGPGDATLTLSLYIYKKAFEAKALGYASALGIIMFLVLFAFTMLYFIIVREKREN